MIQKTQSGNFRYRKTITAVFLAAGVFLFLNCSFDYGQMGVSDEEQPEVVMHDVEYVRVEDGEPMVMFDAEKAEHYEESRTMRLSNFSFTQFNQSSDAEAPVDDTTGFAGSGVVHLDSKDVVLDDGVRIDAVSEDMQISTETLHWKDRTKELNAGAGDEVNIERSDGTLILGRGFSADLRTRTWEFSEGISGTYVYEEEDSEN